MDRRNFLKTTALTAAALALNQATPIFASVSQGTRLVMVGWDGAGLNNITPMLAAGRLPNLATLVSRGQIMPVLPVTATLTVPSWTAMFTGLTPTLTGVQGNRHYEGELIDLPEDTWFWVKTVPYSWTFPAALRNAGVEVGWFTSKTFLGINSLKSPLCWVARNATEHTMILPKFGLDTYAEDLTTLALDFITSRTSPFFVFLHLDPDRWGHLFGENSPEYLAEFERCDAALGRLMDIQGDHGFALLNASDHGFNEGGFSHLWAPDCWFAGDLQINPKWLTGGATTLDLAPTVLGYYNLPIHNFKVIGKDLR